MNNHLGVWETLKTLLRFRKLQHPKPLNLVVDPHSLNLESICPLVGQIHEILRTTINEVTTNLDMVKWFDRAPADFEEVFLNNLLGMMPLYPKLASEIYRVSPFGICRQMVGRFDRTNAIVRLSESRITAEMLTNEISLKRCLLRGIT